jgi:hypothetical protein
VRDYRSLILSICTNQHMAISRLISFFAVFAIIFQSGGAEQVKKSSPGVVPLPDPLGVHNLFALGTNIYSGSTPEGEEGFAALKKMGVRTIISVDGAKPNVELAKKHGMRYVHLPNGYDGISTNLQLQLARAGETLPRPIYVHCHHGKHRGPTAAAVICMANDGWSSIQADQWLRTAGTATNYSGLYEVVKDFKKPSIASLSGLPSDFPEAAKVSGLVDSMVGIDERWENLKAVRAAGYLPPENHPDLKPANEAVILWEHYREAQRFPDTAEHGADLSARFKAAEDEVKEAERLLRLFAKDAKPDIRAQLDKSFDAIGKTCASCHKIYRDAPGIKSAR